MGGETYQYQVYVPLEYTRQRKWPVIVALHADGSQGSDGETRGTRGLLRGVHVGGHSTFRPTTLIEQLMHLDVVKIADAPNMVEPRPESVF